jgi:hypothetical protein
MHHCLRLSPIRKFYISSSINRNFPANYYEIFLLSGLSSFVTLMSLEQLS